MPPSTGIDRLLIGPSQHLPSAPYINNPMTAYTAPQVRKIIDDLDDIFRAAAQNGRVKAVFARERKAIDALMCTTRTTTDNAELQHEFQVMRFLWRFADVYQGARRAQGLDGVFWDGLAQVLKDFDAKYPTAHRTPVPGVPPPVHPTIPIIPPNEATFRVMMPTRPRQQEPTPVAGPSMVASDSDDEAMPAKAQPQVPVHRVPVPGVRISGRPSVPVPVPSARIIVQRPVVPHEKPLPPTQTAAGPSCSTQDRQISPLTSSSEESPRVPASEKRDKGKKRMRDERPEEEEGSRERQEAWHQEGKKRRPPRSTGQLRENTCRCCDRLLLNCLSQAGGKACVACAQVKMKCVDLGDDGHTTDGARVQAPALAPAQASYRRPAVASKPCKRTKKPVKSAPMVISSDEDETANHGKPRSRTFGDLNEEDLLDDVCELRREMGIINGRLHESEVLLGQCNRQLDDYRQFTQELLERMHDKDDEVAELRERLQRAEDLLEFLTAENEADDQAMGEEEPVADIRQAPAPEDMPAEMPPA
ncbi:hypothetical protein BYT27DRAFT_7253207, partial [Phlegmacium glaucopus]